MRCHSDSNFEQELARELDLIRAQGLYRALLEIDSPQSSHLLIGGHKFINFSANDYLGLSNHPGVCAAALRAIRDYGTGAGASRLVCGSLAPHHRLEEALAQYRGTPAALAFSSGYATALGTIAALVDRDDIIVIDKLVHACIVDAARLSGARIRAFRHNDLNHLEALLKWSLRQHAPRRAVVRPRVLIVTESVFSMDGDIAPLREIVELKHRYGAWLMVDEAHAAGIFGERRCGLVDEFSLSPEVEIQMGTLGKALGSSGGYICGSRALIDLLINRARSFIFSTAPPPAAAAAAQAAIQVVQSPLGERLRRRLWKRVDETRAGLASSRFAPLSGPGAIIPLMVGKEQAALEAALTLRERGIYVPAIRYPSVGRNRARLRVTLSASHTARDVRQLVSAVAGLSPSSCA